MGNSSLFFLKGMQSNVIHALMQGRASKQLFILNIVAGLPSPIPRAFIDVLSESPDSRRPFKVDDNILPWQGNVSSHESVPQGSTPSNPMACPYARGLSSISSSNSCEYSRSVRPYSLISGAIHKARCQVAAILPLLNKVADITEGSASIACIQLAGGASLYMVGVI